MKNLIWYEKYRPEELSDLILNRHTKKSLKKYVKQKEIPHLLLFGPPGGGKTTIAEILIDKCASSKMLLNGSSEDRGVDTVKKKVKNFAMHLIMKNKGVNIVFIDEADGMSSDAQDALKNIIEKYSNNCRFIFACNTIEKITDAIISRCIRFRFDSFPKEKVLEKCINIFENEDVKYKEENLVKIIDRFYPDIRSIINEMQSCSVTGELNLEYLGDPQIDLEKLEILLNKGKINDIRRLWVGSYDFNWLYTYLINKYIPSIKQNKKAAECALIAAEYMNSFGDKEINATACLVAIMMELNVNKIYF